MCLGEREITMLYLANKSDRMHKNMSVVHLPCTQKAQTPFTWAAPWLLCACLAMHMWSLLSTLLCNVDASEACLDGKMGLCRLVLSNVMFCCEVCHA